MENNRENNNSIKGSSTEALTNPNNENARKEKAIELFGGLYSKLLSGNLESISPMVIGVKDGKLIVEECKVDANGNLSLPEIRLNTKKDIALKSKFVRRILQEISPVIHADIDNVSYIALMRKDSEKLEEMMIALQSGAKAKLENRVGCIWLIVGDYEIVL